MFPVWYVMCCWPRHWNRRFPALCSAFSHSTWLQSFIDSASSFPRHAWSPSEQHHLRRSKPKREKTDEMKHYNHQSNTSSGCRELQTVFLGSLVFISNTTVTTRQLHLSKDLYGVGGIVQNCIKVVRLQPGASEFLGPWNIFQFYSIVFAILGHEFQSIFFPKLIHSFWGWPLKIRSPQAPRLKFGQKFESFRPAQHLKLG